MTSKTNGICNGNAANKFIKIADIQELNRPNCKIKDHARVELILNAIINGGVTQLQILTDFDYTITKQRTDDGSKVLSSFGMFEKCNALPEEYKIESSKLFEKYRPIEICPIISHDEKVKHMIEWWKKSSDLLK